MAKRKLGNCIITLTNSLDRLERTYNKINTLEPGAEERENILNEINKSPMACVIYNNYRTSVKQNGNEFLGIDSIIFPDSLDEFFQVLDDWGVDEFVFYDASTAVMGVLEGVYSHGWTIAGGEYVMTGKSEWDKEGKKKFGLKLIREYK